jgi:hypothetical protein
MEDYSRACRVLGVAEGASRKEIEDRYMLLVKKYKGIQDGETPSPGEPTFAVINEAYRQLCGFAPLEKDNFRELNWKQKLRYLREHYTPEITMIGITLLALVLIATGVYQLHEWNRNVQEIQRHEVDISRTAP